MKDQIVKKEKILETYKTELINTNELLKYLQLEFENYKKMNNIFKPRNDSPTYANGFFPVEISDKIKLK